VARRDNWNIRVKLSFVGKVSNRFNALKEVVGIQEDGEVIRDALQLYEYLALETKVGTEFFVRNAEGEIVPHPFFGESE
jgi:hypothetical protein